MTFFLTWWGARLRGAAAPTVGSLSPPTGAGDSHLILSSSPPPHRQEQKCLVAPCYNPHTEHLHQLCGDKLAKFVEAIEFLSPGLEQLLDTNCRCQAGHHTVITQLALSEYYSSPPRPDRHQPIHSGPASDYSPGGQQKLYWVPPQPLRATRDTRRNTMGSLLEGYNQPLPTTPLSPGHDQDLFDPQYGVANLQRAGGDGMAPRGGRGRAGSGRQLNNQIPAVSIMFNGNSCCFAVAAFLFLVAAEVGFLGEIIPVNLILSDRLEPGPGCCSSTRRLTPGDGGSPSPDGCRLPESSHSSIWPCAPGARTERLLGPGWWPAVHHRQC